MLEMSANILNKSIRSEITNKMLPIAIKTLRPFFSRIRFMIALLTITEIIKAYKMQTSFNAVLPKSNAGRSKIRRSAPRKIKLPTIKSFGWKDLRVQKLTKKKMCPIAKRTAPKMKLISKMISPSIAKNKPIVIMIANLRSYVFARST